MSFVSSFDIVSAVVPDPKIFLCILASAPAAAAVYPDRIKTLLAYCLITVFIDGKPVFSRGSRSLPDCIILNNRVFDSLISVDK